MKILITGTAGFIGFHLVKKLIHEGYQILGLDSINNYYDENLKYGRLAETGIYKENIQYNKVVKSDKLPEYSFIQIKLEDKENLQQVFKTWQPDYVCNLAAQAGVRYSLESPETYVQSNMVGFLNILECCRNFDIKHLVFASSSSVYGLNSKIPYSVKHSTEHPISLYAASKKSNELMAHSYSHLFGIPTTGLRFFTVYGPWGRPDMAFFLFTKAILEGKPIKVYNNGEMSRDFTYIDDIVEGIKRIIPSDPQKNENWDASTPDPSSSIAPYRIYNIGKNKSENLMDFVHTIEDALDKKAEIQFMPIQPGDVKTTFADVNELINNFDYKPTTTIQEGIGEFVKWYKHFYSI